MDEKNKRSNAHISILLDRRKWRGDGGKVGVWGVLGGLKQTQRVKWSMMPTEKIAVWRLQWCVCVS